LKDFTLQQAIEASWPSTSFPCASAYAERTRFLSGGAGLR